MRLTNEQSHRLFRIGVVLKGIDGLLELLGGFGLLATTPAALRSIVGWLTRGELQEDPTDFVANHLVHFFRHLSINTEQFASVYLLTYGAVKLGLVAGLLRNKLWAYPAALILLGLFLCYQVLRFIADRSPGLGLVSVADLAILVLIWCEYRRLRRRGGGP